ncbi:hypothetical protein BFJ65_g7214 [Fusarium oxysporum f. sp. cepae]|uniref:Zn(2)-C6 fungal-type domain-containing protein n=1 Tax=Fusarium oxysporum f. sp. cepae TaxID=396571 RepID=A0A3L6MR77_FUSOX|nr:hypothetical protein BFJ65_g18195 [Fusarium oxysporum f. sp. cepae]RKK07258.1 hypothetical protein BFJ65_g17994 [Fusarium oxysporum f. sp. cepae]RKK08266.1 hypothetical protein BFJ65_g16926 [Fusarium oxysporum f. sp. cepae]RKK08834.1 hypothetical protein BFJ65_g16494 [Fusarium oxysporum f. sp. cepae]RKK09748.1 hypothetical protein BFJ65_g16193 [Fusarium oxysporum f. sp. cepae]
MWGARDVTARICVGSSLQTQRRLARAKLIASTGYEIMPCSFCTENHTKCMMKEGWKNCSECTRRGRSCDGKGVTLTEADRLVQEKNRIEADEEATEEELIQLQRQLNERLSKLMRLRRQKRLIQTKGLRALEKELATMSDSEKADCLVPEADRVVESVEAGAPDLIDWSVVFDPSFVVENGTSSGVVGHS